MEDGRRRRLEAQNSTISKEVVQDSLKSRLALAQYSLKPRDGSGGKAEWRMSVQVSRGRAGSAQGGDSDAPTETVSIVRPASEGAVVPRH